MATADRRLRARARPRLHTAPLALASDGALLLNVARLVPRDDLDLVIEHAREHGGPIFVGVVVPASEVPAVLRDIDDAAADIAARIGGGLQRRGGRR